MLEDVMLLLKKAQGAKEMQVLVVGFAGNIKMITMKKLILLLLFIPLVSFGQKIYGVDYSSQSDVKVYVVDYESRSDLKVYKVDYVSQAIGNDGLWHFVNNKSQADKKIFFVNYASQSDLKVFFVKYKSQAGWRNSSKKHLIY